MISVSRKALRPSVDSPCLLSHYIPSQITSCLERPNPKPLAINCLSGVLLYSCIEFTSSLTIYMDNLPFSFPRGTTGIQELLRLCPAQSRSNEDMGAGGCTVIAGKPDVVGQKIARFDDVLFPHLTFPPCIAIRRFNSRSEVRGPVYPLM